VSATLVLPLSKGTPLEKGRMIKAEKQYLYTVSAIGYGLTSVGAKQMGWNLVS